MVCWTCKCIHFIDMQLAPSLENIFYGSNSFGSKVSESMLHTWVMLVVCSHGHWGWTYWLENGWHFERGGKKQNLSYPHAYCIQVLQYIVFPGVDFSNHKELHKNKAGKLHLQKASKKPWNSMVWRWIEIQWFFFEDKIIFLGGILLLVPYDHLLFWTVFLLKHDEIKSLLHQQAFPWWIP